MRLAPVARLTASKMQAEVSIIANYNSPTPELDIYPIYHHLDITQPPYPCVHHM